MNSIRNSTYSLLRSLEKYTGTDMVYLAKGGFWINANTVIVTLFSFLLSILFAKYLQKEVYGNYQFIISISSIIGALTLTGMNTAVSQSVARGFEGVFRKSVVTQIRFSIIPILLGMFISLYYFLNDNLVLSLSVLIVSTTIPFTNAFNTWTAYISAKKDFYYFFIFNQLINFGYYFGLILLVIFLPSILWLVFFSFTLNTLLNFLVYLFVLRKYRPSDQFEEEAIDYGKKFSLSNIIPFMVLNLDNIVVFHYLGATQLAIYAFASNVPERLGGLLRPVSLLAFPKFSEKGADEVRRIAPRKAFQLFWFALAGALVYCLLAPLLFRLFFPQYLESILYSQFYALAIAISTSGNLLFTALSSIRSKYIYRFNFLHPIFSVSSLYIMIYFFGIWGAVVGKIIGNTLFLITAKHYLKKP
ncbi:MAG: oligosaccharide flippase family protein [Minisyncoccia bacterium]